MEKSFFFVYLIRLFNFVGICNLGIYINSVPAAVSVPRVPSTSVVPPGPTAPVASSMSAMPHRPAPPSAQCVLPTMTADQPQLLCCPLSHDLFDDPVVDKEGNSYSRIFIEQHVTVNNKSPMTRAAMALDDLLPNRVLAALVDEYRSGQARFAALRDPVAVHVSYRNDEPNSNSMTSERSNMNTGPNIFNLEYEEF
jgi:hypothetical protein